MREIKAFMRKDLFLNVRGAGLSLACMVICPVLIGTKFSLVESAMAISGIFSIVGFLAGICYMEDNEETRQFLKSMPVSKKKVVGARYILTFMLIILSGAIGGTVLGFDTVLISTTIEMICFGVFLLLFYRFNFNFAQIAIVTGVMFCIFLEKTGFSENVICPGSQFVVFLVGIIVYLVSFYLASE